MAFVPYMAIYDNDNKEVEITHSLNEPTIVHIEKPDPIFCFKEAEIELPHITIKKRFGFTDEEMSDLVYFCRNNSDDIQKYSKLGGVQNA